MPFKTGILGFLILAGGKLGVPTDVSLLTHRRQRVKTILIINL
jgi:hypothetical protein